MERDCADGLLFCWVTKIIPVVENCGAEPALWAMSSSTGIDCVLFKALGAITSTRPKYEPGASPAGLAVIVIVAIESTAADPEPGFTDSQFPPEDVAVVAK